MRTMRRETLGGWSMIIGALLGVITMALHPTGGGEPMLSRAVHAIALFGTPLTLYGTWVLTRRLAVDGALAELGLAFHAMAAVAALIAASASGLIAPELAYEAARAGPASDEIWHAVRDLNYYTNQAAAKVLVAAASLAILLWSIEILRTASMRRITGALGCVVASLALIGLLSGHLRMDVHGFGAVVLGHAVWLVMAGAELRRS